MSELKTILLAEDNPQDAELVLEILADKELTNRFVLVKDGVEALEYLRCTGRYSTRNPGHPAVLVLDIKMPRMDGFDLLQTIRADPALALIPVVMLTSSQVKDDVLRSYELGCNAYVVKPVNFQAFVDAVQQIGVFWAILNEPPPKRIAPHAS